MKGTHTSNLEEIKKKLPKPQLEFHEQNGWRFEFVKGGIMPSEGLDMLQDNLALNAVPDVVYSENYARLMLPSADLCLEFTAKDSLLLTNFKARGNALLDRQAHADLKRYAAVNNVMHVPSEVKVKYAETWNTRKIDDPTTEIKNISQISDVFFSTAYKGTVKPLSVLSQPEKEHNFLKKLLESPIDLTELDVEGNRVFPYAEHTKEEIPLHNLTEANQIIWTNFAYLWEDELGIVVGAAGGRTDSGMGIIQLRLSAEESSSIDSIIQRWHFCVFPLLGDAGSTMSEVRFRVMGDCWFALLRHYLRVDDVLIRVVDTRFYHEFGKNYLLREFQVREDSYANISKKGFNFTPKWMLDQGQSHMVYSYLPVIMLEKEKVVFA